MAELCLGTIAETRTTVQTSGSRAHPGTVLFAYQMLFAPGAALRGVIGGKRFDAGDRYLQPAQDEEEHPPQPEPLPADADDGPFEDLPMPKRDRRFSVFFEPHFSQHTSGFDPKTSFSKSALQALQWYS